MRQWEYREVPVPFGQHMPVLDQLGKEGWELASAVPTMGQADRFSVAPAVGFLLLFFKRPVISLVEAFSDGKVRAQG